MDDSDTPTILIAGDNPTSVELMSLMLADLLPVQVCGVENGMGAIRKAQEISPDLIVLDVTLPEVCGFETYQRFRRSSETQHLPIILITASADSSYRAKAFKLGVDDYITKPFEPAEVIMKVSHHLEVQKTHLQLIQNEKMYALGKLLPGVTHEINNSVSFITSTVEPAQRYLKELLALIERYETYGSTGSSEVQAYTNRIDLDYLKHDFPELLGSIKVGANQILDVVQSLMFLSHPAETEQQEIDIHLCINNVLLLLTSQLRGTRDRQSIAILKSYGNQSVISGYPGQLSQVFMNLLSNAIDAIDAKAKLLVMEKSSEVSYFLPRISISTDLNEDDTRIVVKVSDNGIGTQKAQPPQILDPFSTQKLGSKRIHTGLSITHKIIKRHGGTISVRSAFDSGTEFTVTLPISRDS